MSIKLAEKLKATLLFRTVINNIFLFNLVFFKKN